jgi:hypothetical protein
MNHADRGIEGSSSTGRRTGIRKRPKDRHLCLSHDSTALAAVVDRAVLLARSPYAGILTLARVSGQRMQSRRPIGHAVSLFRSFNSGAPTDRDDAWRPPGPASLEFSRKVISESWPPYGAAHTGNGCRLVISASERNIDQLPASNRHGASSSEVPPTVREPTYLVKRALQATSKTSVDGAAKSLSPGPVAPRAG